MPGKQTQTQHLSTFECANCHKVYGFTPEMEQVSKDKFRATWGRYPSDEELAEPICETCAEQHAR